MSKLIDRVGHYLKSLKDIRAIIFGFALLHLVVTQIWVSHWYDKVGQSPVDIYPDFFLHVPLLLIFASIVLLVRSWWGHFLAFGISCWVLYWLAYASLRGAASAHDVPILSSASLRFWFVQKYVGQPQEFLQLGLALTIATYVVVFFSRTWKSAFKKR